MTLYKDGERRLKENRERLFNDYQKMFQSFMANVNAPVTAETQKDLNLQ